MASIPGPTTPPRPNMASEILKQQKATPGNQGLGARSRSAFDYDADSVRGMLEKDIAKLVTCDFQRYLHYMLSLVGAVAIPKNSTPNRAKVDEDLIALATIMVKVMNANEERTNAIIQALGSYCSATGEKARYPHFVDAFNKALLLTQPLTLGKAKPSPEPGNADFLVFINHHNKGKQSQHGKSPKPHNRMPDTEAVFLDTAVKAYYKSDIATVSRRRSSSLTWPENLYKRVQGQPEDAVPWSKSQSSQEHKVTRKILAQPRRLDQYDQLYAITPLEDSPTLYQKTGDLETESVAYVKEDEASITESPPASQELDVGNIEPESTNCDKEDENTSLQDPSTPSEPVLKSIGSLKRGANAPPEGSRRPGKRSKASVAPSQSATSKGPAAKLTAQITEYGAEAMYNSFGRDHVMNMSVQGDTLFVWYFDHESPIRTKGFDFVQNLPYLLLFLFALQRFQPADFGFIPKLQPLDREESIDVTVGWDNQAWTNDELVQPVSGAGAAALSQPKEVTFSRDHSLEYKDFCLSGRATWVIGGKVSRDNDQGVSAVMKLSYQEKSRTREALFIEAANKQLEEQGLGDARQYLPAIGVSREFPEFSTDKIRTTLEVAINAKAARIPCMVVMPRYRPITSRTTNWNEFFDDFSKLIYCHAALWAAGIEHGDISKNNLMWNPNTQTPKLCDFDLSHFTTHERPTGFSNTGTWIFMADELLDEDAMQGLVERLYRHDIESFLAVLVYVMSRYENGSELPYPPLEVWYQKDYLAVAAKRRFTYKTIMDRGRPPAVPRRLWQPTAHTAYMFRRSYRDHDTIREDLKFGIELSPRAKDKQEQFETVRFVEILLADCPLFKTNLGTFDLQGGLKKILERVQARKQAETETQANPVSATLSTAS